MNHFAGVQSTIRHTQRATARHPPNSAGGLEPLQPPTHSRFANERCVNASLDPNLLRFYIYAIPIIQEDIRSSARRIIGKLSNSFNT